MVFIVVFVSLYQWYLQPNLQRDIWKKKRSEFCSAVPGAAFDPIS